jgi:hypothetical protein
MRDYSALGDPAKAGTGRLTLQNQISLPKRRTFRFQLNLIPVARLSYVVLLSSGLFTPLD